MCCLEDSGCMAIVAFVPFKTIRGKPTSCYPKSRGINKHARLGFSFRKFFLLCLYNKRELESESFPGCTSQQEKRPSRILLHACKVTRNVALDDKEYLGRRNMRLTSAKS